MQKSVMVPKHLENNKLRFMWLSSKLKIQTSNVLMNAPFLSRHPKLEIDTVSLPLLSISQNISLLKK